MTMLMMMTAEEKMMLLATISTIGVEGAALQRHRWCDEESELWCDRSSTQEVFGLLQRREFEFVASLCAPTSGPSFCSTVIACHLLAPSVATSAPTRCRVDL